METNQGELKGNNNSNEKLPPDNDTSSVASATSMDSSCSSITPSSKGQNSVSELVGKSKKAAFSLWTLLHAKNCRLGADRCPHPGCSEAKMMYLHHKTCSAKGVGPCPTKHKGCQDARKLLAHYRRCREIRAKQSQMTNSKNRQQHVCLVCSLVARHAKFTLDRCVTASKNGKSSHYIPSLNLSNDAFQGKRNRSQSFATYSSSSSQEPRFSFSRRPNNGATNGTRGFQALQAAVSCALNSNTSNSKNEMKQSVVGKQSLIRPRAESLDVVRHQQEQRQVQITKEEKNNMSYLYLAAVDNFSEEITEETPKKHTSTARRRSLSCTAPSRKQAPPGGDNTMLQNTTIAEDLQYILGGGS